MSTKQSALMRAAPKAMAAGFLVLFMTVVLYFIIDFIGDDQPKKKPVVHQIAIIKPPPPKPEEKPPEPEIKKEEVKLPEPETPLPDQPQEAKQEEGPPPGENLGLDADGQAGSDAFGLSANKGGRSITLGDKGGGRSQDRQRFAWYTALLQQSIYDALDKNKELRSSNYKVGLKIWLDKRGNVERFELMKSSGDRQTDELIKEALAGMPALKDIPPEDMGQPVKVMITSRL